MLGQVDRGHSRVDACSELRDRIAADLLAADLERRDSLLGQRVRLPDHLVELVARRLLDLGLDEAELGRTARLLRGLHRHSDMELELLAGVVAARQLLEAERRAMRPQLRRLRFEEPDAIHLLPALGVEIDHGVLQAEGKLPALPADRLPLLAVLRDELLSFPVAQYGDMRVVEARLALDTLIDQRLIG
ncbi:MAG TPA: hypothetical protein VLT59_13550, partial [Steroidobacteraceae bacterium]|nr:hypothetical protein [Steroidobacteraceae bacterium]